MASGRARAVRRIGYPPRVRGPLLLVCVVAGCGFSAPSSAPRDDAPGKEPIDAGSEAAIDAEPLGTFGNPVPLTALDTPGSEDDPTLTGDLLEIYFERDGDLYSSVRASAADPWPTPQPLMVINSGASETTPEITDDGLELLFSSNRNGGSGGNDIYVARRPNRHAAFGNPFRIIELASADDDVTPTVLPDHLVMYLSSTRAGGVGGYDLWRSTRVDRSMPWTTPVRVPSLSTAGTDGDPSVDPTETTIYFSREGGGGADLFVATRPDRSSDWRAATPVSELNSGEADEDPWLSPDGHTMFFASTRTGNFELFMATR